MQPDISVIVPIYNTQAYVGACLQSLLQQTYANFEAICVNDGSTDQSLEVAKRTTAGDARFVFLEQENQGLSAARNTGLRHAQGRYVCFLDSDDYYASDTLQQLWDYASEHNLDVLDFSASTFYDDAAAQAAHEEDYSFRQDIEGVLSGEDLFVHYWQQGSYVSSACFHFIRRVYLQELGLQFEEGLLHEDELFTPLLYPSAQRVAFLNKPLYLRRMRMDSIMTSGRGAKSVQSVFCIVQELRIWLMEHAGQYSAAFVDAFAKDIGVLEVTFAQSFAALAEKDANIVLEGLSSAEKMDALVLLHAISDAVTRQQGGVGLNRSFGIGRMVHSLKRNIALLARK